MTSQVKYNTKRCQLLLQLYVHVFDTKRITYAEFEEVTGESNANYSRAIKEFKEMIEKLELPACLMRLKEKKTEEVQIQPGCYTLQWTDLDYSYNIENLNEDELILYSMVITYLLLINNSYVSIGTFENIFPRFSYKVFVPMIEKMRDIIPYDIGKNENQSYYLVK